MNGRDDTDKDRRADQAGASEAGKRRVAEEPYGPVFGHKMYSIRRPFWSWTGRTFYIHSPTGERVMLVKHPFWRAREELVVYANDGTTMLLRVAETRIIARDVRFDVFDVKSNTLVGSIVSRGIRSVARDAWDVLDGAGKALGMMQEQGRPLLRRLVPLVRGQYYVEIDGREGARIVQMPGMFSKEYVLDLTTAAARFDPRLAIACALLALLAEPATS